MTDTAQSAQEGLFGRLEPLLARVAKPVQYVGGEVNSVHKDWAASDVRYIFSKNGGKLGTSGSVAYLFERKGVILVPKEGVDEDGDPGRFAGRAPP